MMQGAIRGLIVALLAVGIALIYRSSRAINFAQAELGFLPATLTSLLVLVADWNYYLAVAVGLVASIALGVIVEFVFIRRFFQAPRLILTVATIGIAQLLLGVTIVLSLKFGSSAKQTFAPPISFDFQIGQTIFNGHDVVPIVVVPIVLAALGIFLKYSALGQGIRGAAESNDRALLLGIPVRRLQSLVWVIATVLGFIAMMLQTGVAGLPRGRPVPIDLIIAALGAAVIGRMDRIPTIVSAAVGLGIINSSVRFDWSQEVYRDFVLASVVIVAVLFVRERTTGRVRGETSNWIASREVKAIPKELRNLPEVRWTRIIGTLAIALFVTTLPAWLAVDRMILVSKIGVYAIIAVSLVVLTGWGGQVSLGHLGVVALGATAAGTVTTRYHWDFSIALLVGGLFGAAALIIVGLPALRAGGMTLGITTLALSVAVVYFINPAWAPWFIKGRLPDFGTGGAAIRPHLFGRIDLESPGHFFFVVLLMLGLSIVIARGLRRARPGRVLIGLRENDRAAMAFGVSGRGPYITALFVSGFLSGIAGALLIHLNYGLNPTDYEPGLGLGVFSMVVLGGLGSIGGAILGAVYFESVQYFLPSEWTLLATGVGLLLVLILLPGGLGAALGDLRDALLRATARRRNIRVPSLLADTRVETLAEATPEHAA